MTEGPTVHWLSSLAPLPPPYDTGAMSAQAVQVTTTVDNNAYGFSTYCLVLPEATLLLIWPVSQTQAERLHLMTHAQRCVRAANPQLPMPQTLTKFHKSLVIARVLLCRCSVYTCVGRAERDYCLRLATARPRQPCSPAQGEDAK